MAEGNGIELSRRYCTAVVAPLLARACPEVPYAAARVGPGSEVLGLDDTVSRDHDWGLRLQVFVAEADGPVVRAALDSGLPESFLGRPVRFGLTGDPVQRSRVDVTTVGAFARDRLGFDPRAAAPLQDWLSLSGQAVLEVRAGEVFRDDTGELSALRRALTWYPDDLWRHLVACDWQRLDHELPFVGRTGQRGDDLGSRLVAARLVGVCLHLAFLLHRTWPPYSKWRGSALTRLDGGERLGARLGEVLAASDWQRRQDALGIVADELGSAQRAVGLPCPDPAVEPFWDRPFLRVDRDLVPGLLVAVEDPAVRALPTGVGSVEQQTDNVDVLMSAANRRQLASTLVGGG